MSKYRNIKTTVDGITFDSKKEAARYGTLKMLFKNGNIDDLRHQVRYNIELNGTKLFAYVADFVYVENGQTVVEDVKSEITRKNPVYRIKKKAMKAQFGIEIKEI